MHTLKDIIPSVLLNLEAPVALDRGRLVNQWTEIAGPKIAAHTRPLLSENGELCVWVDQSTLAFELNQKYRQTFLKRAQEALGDHAVKQIRFRVGQLR